MGQTRRMVQRRGWLAQAEREALLRAACLALAGGACAFALHTRSVLHACTHACRACLRHWPAPRAHPVQPCSIEALVLPTCCLTRSCSAARSSAFMRLQGRQAGGVQRTGQGKGPLALHLLTACMEADSATVPPLCPAANTPLNHPVEQACLRHAHSTAPASPRQSTPHMNMRSCRRSYSLSSLSTLEMLSSSLSKSSAGQSGRK